MKFGVVIFPGSNCDRDTIHVFQDVMHREVVSIWHKETSLEGFNNDDCIVIPGGFSYGDYLRSGAIAQFSPIMKSVIEFANNGGKVMGICNGFQVLCETGLLPGALLHNSNQKFVCKNIYLKTTNNKVSWAYNIDSNRALKIPIAHAEGRYFASDETIQEMKNNGQIVFQYCDENGVVSDAANPNGSVLNIAGVCNKERNVMGMMPHPERAAENELGNTDGKIILDAMLASYSVLV